MKNLSDAFWKSVLEGTQRVIKLHTPSIWDTMSPGMVYERLMLIKATGRQLDAIESMMLEKAKGELGGPKGKLK